MLHIHTVRLDVLLWALGGFAEPAAVRISERMSEIYYADHEIRRIKRLATKSRTPKGEGSDLADDLGRSRGSVRVMVCRVRRGSAPPSWDLVV